MGYLGASVQVASWAGVDDDVKISYLVFPSQDTIEFTLGSHGELEMRMSEAGLRHCVAAFTSALEAFEAAAGSELGSGEPGDGG
jgi:hypothetical protein